MVGVGAGGGGTLVAVGAGGGAGILVRDGAGGAGADVAVTIGRAATGGEVGCAAAGGGEAFESGSDATSPFWIATSEPKI